MAEQKYRFNPQDAQLRAHPAFRLAEGQAARCLALTPGLLVGVLGIFLVYQFMDSPKEATFRRENQQLLLQYELLNKQLGEVDHVLDDVRRRDDNIYRVIFEADPLPENMRQAGAGGVDRYKDLSGFASSDLVIDTKKRLDKMTRQLVVQSRSLDEVASPWSCGNRKCWRPSPPCSRSRTRT